MHGQSAFDIRNADEVQFAGGKAYSLRLLIQAGCNVPPGFVVSASVFRKMTPPLKTQILSQFDALQTPFVAVRSSAVNEDSVEASWAGQLDTFLNVNKDALVQSIEKCWESADSARSHVYANHMVATSGAIAVIVQSMVQSTTSGVAFSCHPVTRDTQRVVIEAGLGLGEAIVSGAVTPDLYEVEKQTGRILHKEISEQSQKLIQNKFGSTSWVKVGSGRSAQKISDTVIKQLSRTVEDLEAFFGYAVDVEWAICDSTLYILQCRPVTGLLKK